MVISEQTLLIRKQMEQYYGVDYDWKQYDGKEDGLYMDITFPDHMNFQHPPYVHTYLTCKSHCWTTEGVTSIYKLTNKGFRVYIRQNGITVAKAQGYEWKLHFKVESMDWWLSPHY